MCQKCFFITYKVAEHSLAAERRVYVFVKEDAVHAKVDLSVGKLLCVSDIYHSKDSAGILFCDDLDFSGLTRHIRHVADSSENCELVWIGATLHVRTTKNIAANEELKLSMQTPR